MAADKKQDVRRKDEDIGEEENVDQDPGERQKQNQNTDKEDPLAA